MANLDLRPLSLGEILDRSFALYRQHFTLFIGIAAIPQLFVLLLSLAMILLGVSAPGIARAGSASGIAQSPAIIGTAIGVGVLLGLALIIVMTVAYLWMQGATVSAVSDLYLGRPTTIGGALRKTRSELGNLFGVGLLSGLVTGLAFILLISPGIYVTCRLLVAVPVAVIEDLGARDTLERSFALTKENAGRAFLIILLYFALAVGVTALFTFPGQFALIAVKNNPGLVLAIMAVNQILSSIGTVLITPVLLISSSVFYFDLRVRKEAFDLQMLMNPQGSLGPAASGIPSPLA